MTTTHPNYAPLSTPAAPRLVSLDVLRGLAILLMIFSGMIPKTLPSWMDHGYQPHVKPDATGVWVSALDPNGNAVFDGRWKAMTWVDLVFPMFLFSMGAAIPIALTRKLERGEPKLVLVRTLFARWLMLLFFALLISNLSPPSFGGLGEDARKLFLLAATGVAFLFFVRWPAAVPAQSQRTIRWLAGLVLVFFVVANATQRSSIASAAPGRSGLLFGWANDTIIAVLAYTYLVAGLAWLVTARWPWLRFVLLLPVMLVAHYIAIDAKAYPDWLWMGDWPFAKPLFTTHGGPWTLKDVLQSPMRVLDLPSWIASLREASATRPWLLKATNLSALYNFTWLKYLWIVVPGTIVGDWLVRRSRDAPAAQWVNPMTGEIEAEERPFPRRLILCLAVATIVLTCVGLRHYGFPTLGLGGPMATPWFALTFVTPLLILTAIVAISRVPRGEWLVRRLCVTGAIFGTIGLLLACLRWPPPGEWSVHWRVPENGVFEGGISKGPPAALSYYFLTTGLCMQLLAGLFGVLDARSQTRRRIGLIEANGQNPLLVYFLDHLAISAVFGLAIFAPFHLAGAGDSWWSHVQTLDDIGRSSQPWVGAAWGAFKTLLIAVFVWMLTRRRIYWQA
jgi:predicted acyltransferase